MCEPRSNYRFAPVDAFWEKTHTYKELSLVLRQFHRHYSDLFLKLAPTRVTFLHRPHGGGKKWTPNEFLCVLETPNRPDHPIVIGEFVDIKGRRYVMFVNASMKKSVYLRTYFRGGDAKLYVYNQNGELNEGFDVARTAHYRTDTQFRVGHMLGPGQSFIYRVDSSVIRRTPIKIDH